MVRGRGLRRGRKGQRQCHFHDQVHGVVITDSFCAEKYRSGNKTYAIHDAPDTIRERTGYNFVAIAAPGAVLKPRKNSVTFNELVDLIPAGVEYLLPVI